MDAQETRRLLELAAKAAGYEVDFETPCGNGFRTKQNGRWTSCWSPLHDDGDSRRLEVALEMNVYTNYRYCIAEIVSDGEDPPVHEKEYCNCSTNGAKAAATRLAVLRAAAAIGEAMQERGAA